MKRIALFPVLVLGLSAGCAKTNAPPSEASAPVLVEASQAGQVVELLVEVGQHVWAKEPVMRLRTELPTATNQVNPAIATAQAELELAEAEAAQQRMAARLARDELLLARRELIETLARWELARVQADCDEAERALAERQYTRAVAQAKERTITPDDLAEREAALEAARQRQRLSRQQVEALRARLGMAGAELRSSLEGADEAVVDKLLRTDPRWAAAGHRLAQALAALGVAWKPAEEILLAESLDKLLTLPNDQVPAVRVARLHLEQAQANSPNSAKGTFDVRAPRDGRVAEIKVEVGSRVEPGMVLLVLQ